MLWIRALEIAVRDPITNRASLIKTLDVEWSLLGRTWTLSSVLDTVCCNFPGDVTDVDRIHSYYLPLSVHSVPRMFQQSYPYYYCTDESYSFSCRINIKVMFLTITQKSTLYYSIHFDCFIEFVAISLCDQRLFLWSANMGFWAIDCKIWAPNNVTDILLW